MPSTFTPLGDGTLTVGTVPNDFSCEVLGWKVTHTYEEVGTARTMLCGTERPASKKRTDGMTGNVENDLGAAGMYAYLLANDLTEQVVTFTPNATSGASWVLTCQLSLPADIGADEYGAPIVSAVTWAGVGTVDFTEATAA